MCVCVCVFHYSPFLLHLVLALLVVSVLVSVPPSPLVPVLLPVLVSFPALPACLVPLPAAAPLAALAVGALVAGPGPGPGGSRGGRHPYSYAPLNTLGAVGHWVLLVQQTVPPTHTQLFLDVMFWGKKDDSFVVSGFKGTIFPIDFWL